MAGTIEGGHKARNTIKERYGEDFYRKIGQKGGSVCVPKGFALNHKLASLAGRKGGSISRRLTTLAEA